MAQNGFAFVNAGTAGKLEDIPVASCSQATTAAILLVTTEDNAYTPTYTTLSQTVTQPSGAGTHSASSPTTASLYTNTFPWDDYDDEVGGGGTADDVVGLTGSSCSMWGANTGMMTGSPGKTNFLSAESTSLSGLGGYTGIDDDNFTSATRTNDYRGNSTNNAHAKKCLQGAGNLGALIFCYFFNDNANTITNPNAATTTTPLTLNYNVSGIGASGSGAYTGAEKTFAGQVQRHLFGQLINSVQGAFDSYFCTAFTTGMATSWGYSTVAASMAVETCNSDGAAAYFLA